MEEERSGVDLDGNETDAMSQHFVHDHGGVVLDINMFECDRRHFRWIGKNRLLNGDEIMG